MPDDDDKSQLAAIDSLATWAENKWQLETNTCKRQLYRLAAKSLGQAADWLSYLDSDLVDIDK